jgi:methylmalonyl-CoA mutase N-terminal domain/subunit
VAVTLTRRQPYINIVRTTIQALSSALAGVQFMNLSSFDEAYQTPTEEGATIARPNPTDHCL